jgi:uncharacterized damage-inducible protein DinB
MKIDELRTLFAYDTWATDLLLDAVKALSEETIRRDLGTSHQSLLGTLVHVVAAEEIWLSRWKGVPRSKLTGLEEIQASTRSSGGGGRCGPNATPTSLHSGGRPRA